MSFGMLSEASDVVIRYALLLRIKAKVLRQKTLILCDYLCQQQSPLRRFVLSQLRNPNRYSFAPHCKYCSLLCGLKPTGSLCFFTRTSERARASCAFIIIAVTRLSASSTWLGSTLGSPHQSALSGSRSGCTHTCKTEADS